MRVFEKQSRDSRKIGYLYKMGAQPDREEAIKR